MKLIHRIPYCRDIAIWYDEFLAPGEGWNEAITEAMAKSKLVTLAVTPSVIEPDNFIIKHEYPEAKKAGKKIVPAEIVSTDRDALARLFQGIADPVDGTDEKTMEKALQSMAIQNNDQVPEHNFLIGLAYLGAIDVERDPERAVELITSAVEAETPVIEAIDKLVSMYQNGEGVERNYMTAVKWQEKLITALEKSKEDPLADEDMFQALLTAGNMWKKLGKIEQAREFFEKMLSNASQRVEIYASPNAQEDLYGTYLKLCELCVNRGDMTGAGEYAEKAAHLSETLADETQMAEHRRGVSVSYEWLGRVCEKSGDINAAKEYYRKALRLREALAEEIQTAEARQALSASYVELGWRCQSSGDLSGAREYYLKALHLCEALAKETHAVKAYEVAAISCFQIGTMGMVIPSN